MFSVWRWDADPFGTVLPDENPDGDAVTATFNWRFPGQYYDSETKLYHNVRRDYAPQRGRYVQSDPIGLAGGVNTYGYVGGNPVSQVDPDGLLFEWMGGPWTGFGSDISTAPNATAIAEGMASGYGLGSGLSALAKIGRAVDAALPKCPEIAKGASDDAFRHGLKYADRVRARGVQDPKSHNFPYSFDDEILATKPIPKNNGYEIFQKPGTMNGKEGIFEMGVNKNGIIDHRFFRPDK